MDSYKVANKKGVINKIWKSCKSFSGGKKNRKLMMSGDQMKVAPMGCFPVYVGPEKERFVIRAEQVNHPLFKNLLEEAESEYGYGNKGPLMIPCQVDHFVRLLMEMDYCDDDFGSSGTGTPSSFSFLSPTRCALAV